MSHAAPPAPAAPCEPDTGEHSLMLLLKAGDERAFAVLVTKYHAAMVRVARAYVREPAVAEEVVQDAWLGALRGIAAFEGRASLKTWLFRIVVNRARTAARREARVVCFTDAFGDGLDDREALFDASRFRHPLAAGHWTEPLRAWSRSPEDEVLDAEVLAVVEAAVEALPPGQRAVITLRDIEGWDAAETCNTLGLSDVHQRVLLHRARTKVRRALERYHDGVGEGP